MNDPEQKEGLRFPVTKTNQSSDGLEILPYILPIVFLPMMGVQGVLAFALTVICVVVAIIFHIVKKKEIERGTEWWEKKDEELVFHGQKGIKKFPLNGLAIGSHPYVFRLVLTTPDGKKQNLPIPTTWNGTRPVSEEFFFQLAKKGVKLEGTNLNLESYDPSDFRVTAKLTSAVNWRWEGCAKLDQFQEHKTKLVDTQVIKISNGMVSIIRKNVELLNAPIRDCRLVRVLGGQGEGAMARYLLEVKGKDKWPLLDWNSSQGESLKEAFLNRKVPLIQDPPAEEPPTEYLTDVRKIVVSYNDWSHKLTLVALQVPLLMFTMNAARSLGGFAEACSILLFFVAIAFVLLIHRGRYELREDGISFFSFTRQVNLKLNALKVNQTESRVANPVLNWFSTMEPTSTPDFILSGDPGVERLQILKSLEDKGAEVDTLGVQTLDAEDIPKGVLKQKFNPNHFTGLAAGFLSVTGILIMGTRASGLTLTAILAILAFLLFSMVIALYVLYNNEWPSPWNQRSYRISERGLEVLTKRGSLHSIAFGEIRHLVIETRKGFIDQNSARLSIRTLYGRRLVLSRWTTRLDPALLTLISLARGRGLEVIIADQDVVDRHKEGEEGEVLYEAKRQDGPVDAVINKAGEETVVENQNA